MEEYFNKINKFHGYISRGTDFAIKTIGFEPLEARKNRCNMVLNT